jgi:hypothetical protein
VIETLQVLAIVTMVVVSLTCAAILYVVGGQNDWW